MRIMLALLLWPAGAAADDVTLANPNSIWDQPGDKPGCSFLENANANAPGRTCRQQCCAVHDKCFADNGCTEKSWTPMFENDTFGLGLGPWLGFLAGITLDDMLTPLARSHFGTPDPGSNDTGPGCQSCDLNVELCWGASTFGLSCPNPGNCPSGQESCYDRSCATGRAYYCATDCYAPSQDKCEQEFGDERCGWAFNHGYGTGGTRYGMHGGAFLTCTAWCYNNASASGQLNPAYTLCAGDYDEENHNAWAGGWYSSLAGGSICCYCGGVGKGLPFEDAAWPYEAYRGTPGPDGTPTTHHSGSEGGHGSLAGCPSGCPCPPGAPCYNINGCWNDSHMCAQATCGSAVGMCCG
jgi:hypothetical protein